jgi:hypothetical protein
VLAKLARDIFGNFGNKNMANFLLATSVIGSNFINMIEDKKEALLRIIHKRIAHDRLWGALNFGFAQFTAWTAVISSLGSAIAVAAKWSPVLIAILGLIPGVSILVARGFNFMPLSRWHHRLASRLEGIENSLEFEGMTVADASREYSKWKIEFNDKSPTIEVGLLERPATRSGGRAKRAISL